MIDLKDNVSKMLIASTAHIPRRTAVALGECTAQGQTPQPKAEGPYVHPEAQQPWLEMPVTKPELWDALSYTFWSTYGWILYTSEEQASQAEEGCHPELANLIRFAEKNGFAYLMLDCDAAELPESVGLPTFNW